jgi:putative hydrolase
VTDNLFDRLGELFRSPGPVNWRLAREIAESVAGPPQPVDPWAAEQFHDLAATAQRMVTAETGLDALAAVEGAVRVVDRRTWAGDNVETLAYIAEPVAERIAALGDETAPGMSPIAAPLLGMQIGSLMGFTSHRVLATFDVGIALAAATPLTFVAPNVAELSAARDLDEQQVRMWVALHEVTHHAEMAVPWVRDHLRMLGHSHAEEYRIDPEAVAEQLRLLQDPEALQTLLDRPDGLSELGMPIEAGESAERIAALAALLEGYADVVVERTGRAYMPQFDGIRAAALGHRADAAQGETMLHRALGMAFDPELRAAGATFCRDVARRWGDEALERVWEEPDTVPTPGELTDPTGWAARVLL